MINEMELQVAGKKLITEPIKNTLVQGENNVDIFNIVLPKMHGDINLSDFSFKIRGTTPKNTLAEQLLPVAMEEDRICLRWAVSKDFTALEGALRLELIGVGLNGDEIIKFTSGDITVQADVTGEYAPPADLLEQTLAQMQVLASKAASEADRASRYVGKSAYDLWLEEGNTGSAEDFLRSLKGENGLGLKILGTFNSVSELTASYPDGGALNGGFMCRSEYYYWDTLQNVWKSAGSLQGAKGDKGDRGNQGEKGDTGKMTVVTNLTESFVNLTVQDNTEYQYGTLTSLSLLFPAGSFGAVVCFSSGSLAPAVSFPAGTKFLGCDVTEGVFAPVANRRYQLGIWFDGLYTTVVAGGF